MYDYSTANSPFPELQRLEHSDTEAEEAAPVNYFQF